ncbi:MAG: hypothetical protein HUJ65_08010, partial [Oscillospiraceae bacterium]|nr:hypothetical protein [Oscillospiraceae bacterium]
GKADDGYAVDEIKDALSILGEDYMAVFNEIIESPHIDVYAKDTKTRGGFMTSCGDSGIAPYILLNYSGFANEASTIAHEMGHAVYGYLSEHSTDTNRTNNMPTIFTHEVASTCNEYIYYNYKMEHASTEDERLFYLENILTLINSTIIRQVMYTEFEDYIYKKVEAGMALGAEELCDKWFALNSEYYGDSVTLCENMHYRWAAIPHFYYGYYVYKYATSATYSSIIAQRILSGDADTLVKYKQMLARGNSAKASELLCGAGVDPADKAVYSEMTDYYKKLVDEYERLIVK